MVSRRLLQVDPHLLRQGRSSGQGVCHQHDEGCTKSWHGGCQTQDDRDPRQQSRELRPNTGQGHRSQSTDCDGGDSQQQRR